MTVQARRYFVGALSVGTTYWGRTTRDYLVTCWLHSIDVTFVWDEDAWTQNVQVPSQLHNVGASDELHREAIQLAIRSYEGKIHRSIVEMEILSQLEKEPLGRDESGKLKIEPRTPIQET